MPLADEKSKAGDGAEVLRRLLQLVTVRKRCAEEAARCEGQGAGYADWVVDVAKTEAEIKESLPAAFAFLLDLKREVGR